MLKNGSGKIGEDYTTNYLEQKGYKIVCRNFHSRFGEIDIIAQNGKYIVFVEVKTRQKGFKVHPLEAVTISKRQKIISTAQIYIMKNRSQLQPRFDVAAVFCDGNIVTKIDYIENAF